MQIDWLLRRSAELYPEVVAVHDERVRWTYRELEAVVGAQVAGLSALGVQPGQRVAVLSRNRAEYVALYFATARLGAALVPLNWRLTGPELGRILDDAEAVVVLCEPDFEAVLSGRSFEALARLHEANTAAEAAGYEPADTDVAVQMYTSGTSGHPKGAMLSHRNCCAMTHAWLLDMRLERGDRFLQVTPFFHVGGMLMVLSNIAAGTTLRVLPEFDPVAAIDVLADEATTQVLMVPAMLQWLLREPYLRGKQFPALRLIIYGAAPMPPAALEAARKQFACEFLQGYGLTETTGVLLTLTTEDHAECVDGTEARLASAGRAAPGCLVRVVDEAGADVEATPSSGGNPGRGAIGEIVARGDNISPGYWKDPEATRAAWRSGWFHTGDLARIDEHGYVTVVDRKKDMILVAGENVYPREIELVLLDHPDIVDAAVIGIPHADWGEEVLALVVLADGAPENPRGWIRHCREHLARFKCPTRVEVLDKLPRNAAGKLLKRELREPHWRDHERKV